MKHLNYTTEVRGWLDPMLGINWTLTVDKQIRHPRNLFETARDGEALTYSRVPMPGAKLMPVRSTRAVFIGSGMAGE